MSHKSTFIECDPRETEIIKSRTHFRSVIKLGRGNEVRNMHPSASFAELQADVEELSQHTGKGAIVYACGTAGGLDVSALYATYIPRAGWKFAEAAEEAVS